MAKLLNTAMLLAFAGLLGPHPAPAISGQYQPGTTYLYDYETLVRLNEDPTVTRTAGREVGYKLTGQVKVTNIWQNVAAEKLLKIEILKPNLLVHSVQTKDHHLQNHRSPLDKKLPLPSVYVHWKDGKEYDMLVPSSLDMEIANLFKGVASFFIVQQKNGDAVETDVSGKCRVSYRTSGSKVVKTKTECVLPADGSLFRHSSRVQAAKVSEETYTTYEFNSDATIKTAVTVTKISFGVNIWGRAAIAVFSEGKLSFVSEQKGQKVTDAPTAEEAVKVQGKGSFTTENLVARSSERKCDASAKCKALNSLVKSYKEQLKISNLSTIKSASAFMKVMERMRLATKDEILAVLRDSKNKKILPQLLDAVAAAQTKASLDAATSVLNFNDVDELDAPERFLLCVAASSHPSEYLVNTVLDLAKKTVKNEKIRATILTTLGSVARTYRRLHGGAATIVANARNYLVTELEKCQTDTCKRMYLQGLVNAAFPETSDLLMTFIKNGGKLGVIATTALKKLSLNGDLNDVILDDLRRVFLQLKKPYDSLIRTGAAEILFRHRPGLDTVRDFISTLKSPKDSPEVKAYTMAKLLDMANDYPLLGDALIRISNDVNFWNYHSLALVGGSTSFRRTLAKGQSINGSYGVNVELVSGGLMKRSSFDVSLQSGEDHLQLMSLGLFADGIAGITDGGNEAEAEEESTTAGMELTALDIKVRPYTFFSGTGELMGLVWSGTGSEPTPALQANFLMMDHRQIVPLPSGLVVELRVTGALSSDLSGSIQVSLWNRNSHAVVNSRAALLVHGAAHVETFFAKSHVEFAMGSEARLDCVTDLEFYEKPYKMCIQLDQPGFHFRYNVRKAESVPGSQHLIRTLKKRSIHIPGKSFDLQRKNSEQCAKLLVDEGS